MEDKLYEKIGRQEVAHDALRKQISELSTLVTNFLSGEEKPEDWEINDQGQLSRKPDLRPVKAKE